MRVGGGIKFFDPQRTPNCNDTANSTDSSSSDASSNCSEPITQTTYLNSSSVLLQVVAGEQIKSIITAFTLLGEVHASILNSKGDISGANVYKGGSGDVTYNNGDAAALAEDISVSIGTHNK